MANLLVLTIAGAAGYAALTRTESGRKVRGWWQGNARKLIREMTADAGFRKRPSADAQPDGAEHAGHHGDPLIAKDAAKPQATTRPAEGGGGNLDS